MRRLLFAVIAVVALCASTAVASTSHEGWPKIDGVLKINKADESKKSEGTEKSDELLGGHGNDELWGRESADVLWGDYKPSGQNTTQVDRINGGPGGDFIYASHGKNIISAGTGSDTIHAHFGRGSIDCGGGTDVLFISHKSQKGYKISHCETISYKTSGS